MDAGSTGLDVLHTLKVRLRDAGTVEQISENNQYSFVLDHREKRYRVLYVSGRPNWQHNFITQALEDDPESKLSSLIYISIAAPKFEFKGQQSSLANPLFEGFADDPDRPRYDEAVFLRLGMESDELPLGFPTHAEELFAYDVIVFGDMERDYLSDTQLELVRDFVEKRGGAFLMLGGGHSFTDGGYVGTPIETMLPALSYGAYESQETRYDSSLFQVRPTASGKLSGVWSLNASAEGHALPWEDMPPLYGLNRFPLTRVGATVLSERSDKSDPLFALQRYGEGTTAILSTGETWQWQMQLPKENEQHEQLWRHITRYLSNQVLQPVHWHVASNGYTAWNPTSLAFTVRDEAYEKQEDLQVTLTIQAPSGSEHSIALDESLDEAGLYAVDYIPEETGLYGLRLRALNEAGEVVATLEERMVVEEDHREYRQAQFDGAFLKALAMRSGGAYVSLDALETLPQRIPIPLRNDAQERVLHLWHLPVFYGVIFLLLATEWYGRRKRGCA